MAHRTSEDDVTDLLQRWSDGEAEVDEELFSAVYRTLHRIAIDSMRGQPPGHTLQPTAVVHEAYCRLIAQRSWGWQNRQHFYRIAGRMMRRVLVDHARRNRRVKRGGELVRVPLAEVRDAGSMLAAPEDLLALDRALSDLARDDPEQAQLVELRFFVGLRIDEIAKALGCSTATVSRRWRAAKARLFAALRQERRAGSAVRAAGGAN